MKTISSMAIFAILLILSACGIKRHTVSQHQVAYSDLSMEEQKLTDTLFKNVLENEGLYTIIGGLKPMSTVADLSFKIAQKDSSIRGVSEVADIGGADYTRLLKYIKIIRAMELDDVGFILAPFKMQRSGIRYAAINVFRQSLVDSMVKANSAFYGQFAIAPSVKAGNLITLTEYEASYDRFRSYGNLFGYPRHAVDFFVNAAIHDDDKKGFVERDFYNLPVYSGRKGRFVYALEKGSVPNAVDLAIQSRTKAALSKYTEIRKGFMRKDGSIDYHRLFLRMVKEGNASK